MAEVTGNRDLIFDVGMHEGQDTAYYLRKGYRVVAVEANPDLAQAGAERFAREIRDGRLVVVHGAVVDEAHPDKTVTFFLNPGNSQWGTVDPDRAEEYGARTQGDVDTITVPTIDLAKLLEAETPYYMKTDIEGADHLCLQALARVRLRPAYLSIESDTNDLEAVRRELAALRALGYTAYQIVNQKDIRRDNPDDRDLEYGTSGPFGHLLPPEGWLDETAADLKYRELFVWYRLFKAGGGIRGTPEHRPLAAKLSRAMGYTIPSWYDTHARHREVEVS